MGSTKMPELKIGDLAAKIPIIQGGMGVGISLSGLASAVAKLGAIGVIATVGIGMLESDFDTNFKAANERALRREIKAARKMSNGGIIGVNIMIASSDADDIAKTAVDEGIDLVFLSAGLPLKHPKTLPLDRLAEVKTKFVPKVSSARAAKLIFQCWAKRYNHVPDAVVIEGPLSGGHQGFAKENIYNADFALEKLLPGTISVVKPFEQQFGKSIPVIAAGGIYTGEDIYKFIRMGASGVKMGTRFVATNECDAAIEFKEAYIKCKKEDLVIIDSPVGIPARVIRNKFIDDVNAGIRKPFKCPWQCLRTCDFQNTPYCIGIALYNAKKGDLENGFALAGANAYRINEIVSVERLIRTLTEEYERAALA
ncbi:nitronate monooxygenase [bacterium]|nr:MAG: nitronate monooxygenase [bacterium]